MKSALTLILLVILGFITLKILNHYNPLFTHTDYIIIVNPDFDSSHLTCDKL